MLNPDRPADSSGSYPAANPSTHTVAAGETLASIAKSVFGDSTLWYRIADANGLAGDRDLRVDSDVLVWLKSQGKGYQTRLNVILREAMLKEVTKP